MELRFRKTQWVEWTVPGRGTKNGHFIRYEIVESRGIFTIRAHVWDDLEDREICIEPKRIQPFGEHEKTGGYVSVHL